jgi:hypothetical protein
MGIVVTGSSARWMHVRTFENFSYFSLLAAAVSAERVIKEPAAHTHTVGACV